MCVTKRWYLPSRRSCLRAAPDRAGAQERRCSVRRVERVTSGIRARTLPRIYPPTHPRLCPCTHPRIHASTLPRIYALTLSRFRPSVYDFLVTCRSDLLRMSGSVLLDAASPGGRAHALSHRHRAGTAIWHKHRGPRLTDAGPEFTSRGGCTRHPRAPTLCRYGVGAGCSRWMSSM